MSKIWIHKIFRSDKTAAESEFQLHWRDSATLFEVLEMAFEHDKKLRLRILDERNRLRPHVNIFVGTHNCKSLDGLATQVTDNEEIFIFPSISGG
ncbi:MAG: MoaD/ThiS family protein [Pyrinomonadaceae bacterium]